MPEPIAIERYTGIAVPFLLTLLCLVGILSIAQTPPPAHTAPVTGAGVIELVNRFDQATNDVFVQGGYAYVGQGARLSILDISNPVSPTLIGQTDLLTYTVQDICVWNGYAYVAAGYGGLRVVDVSTPTNPAEIGFYRPSIYPYAHLVDVADGYAYIGSYGGELEVVSIADPANPVPLGSLWVDFGMADIEVKDGYAYVSALGNKGGGLGIVSVVSPTNLVAVGYIATPGYPKGVDVVGDYAYVAFSEPYMILPGQCLGGLQVIDVSDPAGPTTVGSHCRPWPAYDVAMANDYVHAIGDYGLRLFDVADPANPVVVSFYNRRWSTRADGYNLALAGDYIYIAAEEEGFFVLRYSEGKSPIDVVIGGPTLVTTLQSDYRFTASVSPGTASLPVTYTWAPEPNWGQGTALVTYTWTTTYVRRSNFDAMTLSVMATNAEGTAIDTHKVAICGQNCRRVYLPVVFKRLPVSAVGERFP